MSPKRLLVVDDDGAIRTALQKILVKAGYEVFLAESAEAVLQGEIGCDLVLTDYQMSGKNGLELAQELQHRPEPRPRVVIMTAYADLLDRERLSLQKAGVAWLIRKPISRAELLPLLDSVLDQPR